MSYALDQYTGDGSTQNFTVTFPYLAESHVVVRLDTVLQVQDTDYSFLNPTTVQFVSAPALDAVIEFRRESNRAARLVDHEDASTVTEATLDQDANQLLYIAQEAFDTADNTIGLASDGKWDAESKIIKNVLDPVNAQDAATKAYADSTIDAAAASATAAAASAAAALVSENAAELAETNAETAESNAEAMAIAAAASAAAAQTAADSLMWQDVVFLTSVDSPYTITSAHRGKLFAVDCTGGNVTVNLPGISTLDLATNPFAVGVKKTDESGNSITIDANGTDTIDSAATKVLTTPGSGTTLIPDTDSAPDEWTSADFGAAAGNLTVDSFSGDDATVAFALSVAPGSENNTFVFIDGVYQQKSEYSISGTTLTFTSAPPAGTNNIQVVIGTLLSIGVPSDGTVTTAKLDDGAVTHEKRTYNSGEVVQSVYAEYTANSDLTTTLPEDDTIPQNTEGVEVVTASITPKSATNKIRIRFHAFGSTNLAPGALVSALFRDSVANALTAASAVNSASGYRVPISMEFEESAASVSARTYKVRVGPGTAGTARLNGNTGSRFFGGTARATLVIEEIAA